MSDIATKIPIDRSKAVARPWQKTQEDLVTTYHAKLFHRMLLMIGKEERSTFSRQIIIKTMNCSVLVCHRT